MSMVMRRRVSDQVGTHTTTTPTTDGNEKVSKKREKMNQVQYLQIIKARQEVERQRLAEAKQRDGFFRRHVFNTSRRRECDLCLPQNQVYTKEQQIPTTNYATDVEDRTMNSVQCNEDKIVYVNGNVARDGRKRSEPFRKRFQDVSANIALPNRFNPQCISKENKFRRSANHVHKTNHVTCQADHVINPRPSSAPAELHIRTVTPAPCDKRRSATPIARDNNIRTGTPHPSIIVDPPRVPKTARGHKEKEESLQRRSSRPEEEGVYFGSSRRRRNSDSIGYRCNTNGPSMLYRNVSCSGLNEKHDSSEYHVGSTCPPRGKTRARTSSFSGSSTQRHDAPLVQENVVDVGTFISKKLSEWKLNRACRKSLEKLNSSKLSDENVELKDVKHLGSPQPSNTSKMASGSISKSLKNSIAKRMKKTRTPLVDAVVTSVLNDEQNEVIYDEIDKNTEDIIDYQSSQFLY